MMFDVMLTMKPGQQVYYVPRGGIPAGSSPAKYDWVSLKGETVTVRTNTGALLDLDKHDARVVLRGPIADPNHQRHPRPQLHLDKDSQDLIDQAPQLDLALTPMPKGHNSPQESAPKNPNVSRAEPCPRRSVSPATPNTTASQRFLHRFGAGDTLQAATPRPRAMNNPHPQPRQHLLMELQGDLFSDSATTTKTTGNAHGTRKNQSAAHAATGPACHPAAAQTASQHTGGGQQ